MLQQNELRLFISSTFRDMQEEREHLVKKVFPEIRSLCRSRGIRFTEVDLRWGLTDENVKLGQVIRACLEEVDRCRPYFIGITGSRYGYIPSLLDMYKDPGLLEDFPWLERAVLEEMSITEMEAYYAVLGDDTGRTPSNDARFFFREPVAEATESDDELLRLAAFQERIRAKDAPVASFADEESLGRLISDHLIEVIDRDFPDVQPPSPLEEERRRHQAFSFSRRRAYIPNTDNLKRLNEHAASGDPPLVVQAVSGSGKSSLFAFWAHQHRRTRPETIVIEHYVGIGATATDHLAIIRHFCMEVKELFGREESVPTLPESLEQAFGQWAGYADHELEKRGNRLILIIDGLNQLQGKGARLRWIPDLIPPSIRLIISTTEVSDTAGFRDRGWRLFELDPLSDAEREAVIVRYLAEYRKSLNTSQVSQIARDEKCGHPLFLRTMLEELRLVGSHEDLQKRIDESLATAGTDDLFQSVLGRMENDYGADTINAVLSLLWTSRTGLDEEEMSELSGLSPLKIATVITGLDYHLIRSQGRLSFFHDYLRTAVRNRYLEDEEGRREQHLQLARFFESAVVSPRTSMELLYQLHEAGERDRLADALSDLEVFMSLYKGDARYELSTYWSELLSDHDIARMYRAGLEKWSCTEPREVFHAIGRIIDLAQALECLDAAGDLARLRLRYARDNAERDEEGYAHVNLAYPALRVGRLDEAEPHVSTALEIFDSTGNRRGEAMALGCLGGIHYYRGEYDKMLAVTRRTLAMWEELGDRAGAAREHGNIGLVLTCIGDFEMAREMITRQLDICTEFGDREGMANASLNLGTTLIKTGEFDRAEQCFQQALEFSRQMGNSSITPFVVGNLAELHMLRGAYHRAIEDNHRAARFFEKPDDPHSRALASGNIGAAYRMLGDHQQALEFYSRALQIHTEVGHDSQCRKWTLAEYAEESESSSWRHRLLRKIAHDVEEAWLNPEEGVAMNDRHPAEVILARIACEEGDREKALHQLLSVLKSTDNVEIEADASYWIWKLGLDPEVDHRGNSLSLYADLHNRTRNHKYQLRIDELSEQTQSQ